MRALVPIPRPDADPALRQRSSIASLAAAKQITADQVEAAWRFAALWHEMTDGISTIDLLLGTRQASSERAVAAKQKLLDIRAEVGGYGMELLVRVAVEGFAINDIFIGRRPRDMHADLLRLHLTEVALMLRHGPMSLNVQNVQNAGADKIG